MTVPSGFNIVNTGVIKEINQAYVPLSTAEPFQSAIIHNNSTLTPFDLKGTSVIIAVCFTFSCQSWCFEKNLQTLFTAAIAAKKACCASGKDRVSHYRLGLVRHYSDTSAVSVSLLSECVKMWGNSRLKKKVGLKSNKAQESLALVKKQKIILTSFPTYPKRQENQRSRGSGENQKYRRRSRKTNKQLGL